MKKNLIKLCIVSSLSIGFLASCDKLFTGGISYKPDSNNSSNWWQDENFDVSSYLESWFSDPENAGKTPPGFPSNWTDLISSFLNSSEQINPDVVRSVLEIVTPPNSTNFYQYDYLNVSGILVQQVGYNIDGEEIERKKCVNYQLKDADGNMLVPNYTRLKDTGSKTLFVTKPNCESASFEIDITPVNNFNQTLEITSPLNKTEYYVGNPFSKEGLSVNLSTTYRRANEDKVIDEEVENFIISDESNTITFIDGEALETAGRYQTVISSLDWDGNPISCSGDIITIKDGTVASTVLQLTKYPKTDYFKYDYFDDSNIEVVQINKDSLGDEISRSVLDRASYLIVDSVNESDVYTTRKQLKNVGTTQLKVISATDSTQIGSFSITTQDVEDYNQQLIVDASAAKTSFNVSEKYTNSSLVVKIKTTYTRDGKQVQAADQFLKDYNVQIYQNNMPITQSESVLSFDYTFQVKGDFDIVIFYIDSSNNEFTGTYSINVKDEIPARREMILTNPTKTNYDLYDTFSSSGLSATVKTYNKDNDLIQEERIPTSQLSLEDENGNVVNNQYRFDKAGSVQIHASCTKYENEVGLLNPGYKSFTCIVNQVNITENLVLDSLPNKMEYYTGELFNDSGLVVSLSTTKKGNTTKQRLNRDEYSLSISPSVSNNIFQNVGTYTITIEYTSSLTSNHLSTTFTVDVLEKQLFISQTPKNIYYEYGESSKDEHLDFSSLIVSTRCVNALGDVSDVSQLSSSEYTLSENGMPINDNDVVSFSVSDAITHTVLVSSSNYKTTSFNYVVKPVENFSQNLRATGMRTLFTSGSDDNLNLSGISLKLNTSYKRDRNITLNEDLDVSDCTFYLIKGDVTREITLDSNNNVLYNGKLYPLTFPETLTIKIQTSGWRDIVETSFNVTVQ